MNQQPRFHRSLRLLDDEYAQAGASVVSSCTDRRLCHLGRIVEGTMRLALPGQIAQSVWESLPKRFHGIEPDAWISMPNHSHGVLILPDTPSLPLGAIVRTCKATSTRLIRVAATTAFAWQRNDDDHVVRTEGELHRVRASVANNPLQWRLDRENPEREGVEERIKGHGGGEAGAMNRVATEDVFPHA